MVTPAVARQRLDVRSKDIRILVGREIRRLRKRARLSLEALAHEADLTPSYLSNVERGVQNPSLVVLASVARALRTPLAQLVTVDAPSAAALRATITRRLDRLDAAQLEGLARYLDAITR